MDRKVVGIIIGICVVLLAGGALLLSKSGKTETTAAKIVITASDHVFGKETASVTLLEYADFQCPACAAYHPILTQLKKDYPNDLRIVFRHFPLTSIHANAWAASTFVEAAAAQNKFWEAHDKLYETQSAWSDSTNIESEFEKYAKELAIDFERAKKDMYSATVMDRVKQDQVTGNEAGVSGTPTFFVNGVKTALPGSLEQFKKIIEGEIAKNKTEEKVHQHFDVAVYVDGKKVDLSTDKYMEKNESIHFHDNNGDVVHVHKTGVTLGEFVKSLEIDTSKPVLWGLNNKAEVTPWETYVPQDLDRVVLLIGSPNLFKSTGKAVNSFVTDKACIFSETCPERGKPPTEKCVGGLGTDCIDEDE